ncbi:hypothetical protein Q0M94_18220 (plasmid) [Deinococcus radiomollis]|uniref:hypothetical protein n=1 Tax=Deinococcus radiomollis TaxID=468916 RepID=UPI003892086D
MKKIVILVPLLGACAPVMTQQSTLLATASTSVPANPFQVGQTWTLSSDSKTDKSIPAKTVFTIQEFIQKINTFTGVVPNGSKNFPIQVDLSSGKSFLVADISPTMLGSKNIRVCFFSNLDSLTTIYNGTAYYYNLSQTANDLDSFKVSYVARNPAATEYDILQAFLVSTSNDTGPCRLESVK